MLTFAVSPAGWRPHLSVVSSGSRSEPAEGGGEVGEEGGALISLFKLHSVYLCTGV